VPDGLAAYQRAGQVGPRSVQGVREQGIVEAVHVGRLVEHRPVRPVELSHRLQRALPGSGQRAVRQDQQREHVVPLGRVFPVGAPCALDVERDGYRRTGRGLGIGIGIGSGIGIGVGGGGDAVRADVAVPEQRQVVFERYALPLDVERVFVAWLVFGAQGDHQCAVLVLPGAQRQDGRARVGLDHRMKGDGGNGGEGQGLGHGGS